ncbi:MAG: serine/threonine-protein phosphatase [Deltaproteobacteria bacterium]|nr:serine/threonine-protein phosphatase [Deltaproteobacteria bacterium]
MLLHTAQSTHQGPRHNNQDSARVDAGLGYAVIADGMGGAAGGAEASRMAIDLTDWLLRRDLPEARRVGSLPLMLVRVFEDVNRWILQKAQATPELRGMGTTLVLVVFDDEHYHVAHAGDSRAYRIRGGELAQITKDHSLVQARVDAGLIRPEDAASQPDRNVITRAVGVDPSVTPDVGDGELRHGDTFVLTTDGVHGVVPARQILEVASQLPPQEAADSLVQSALRLGTTDNSTAVVVRTEERRSHPRPADPPADSPVPSTPPPLSFLQRLLNFGR